MYFYNIWKYVLIKINGKKYFPRHIYVESKSRIILKSTTKYKWGIGPEGQISYEPLESTQTTFFHQYSFSPGVPIFFLQVFQSSAIYFGIVCILGVTFNLGIILLYLSTKQVFCNKFLDTQFTHKPRFFSPLFWPWYPIWKINFHEWILGLVKWSMVQQGVPKRAKILKDNFIRPPHRFVLLKSLIRFLIVF